jgi:phosphoribosylformylglycinamidine (FGAM) synthase-like enzyme
MFVRIEVATRPDFPDPLAQALLKRFQIQDPELRKKIRWARLLDVYWLDIPRAREEIIPACQEIFQDKATQWLFTGNLIPSASGKQGGIEDLMEASPIRPGKFWGLERRLRPGISDSKALAVLEALRMVLGEPLPGIRASTGQMLLLEGAPIREDDLSRLARNWCNSSTETWSFLPEHELSGNERFFQDRVRKDEVSRSSAAPRSSAPTLQSFAQRLGSPRVSTSVTEESRSAQAESTIDWGVMDTNQRQARLRELEPVLGRELALSELRTILEQWNTPDAYRHRAGLGLPRNPTLAELQTAAAVWSEGVRQSTMASLFLAPHSASGGTEAGLHSLTMGATVQQIPKSWIVSGGDHRPAVVALDENIWFSFGLRNSSIRPGTDLHDSTLQVLLGGQRDLIGAEWPSLPLAQTHVHCLPAGAGESQRVGQLTAVELATTRAQVPILAGAEGSIAADSRVSCIGSATIGLVVKKTRESVRSGDRIFIIASGGNGNEHLEDPVFQRRCMDALAEIESLGLASAIRCSTGAPAIAAALRLAREAGGIQAEASAMLGRQEQILVVTAQNLASELQSRLQIWGIELLPCGQFTDSGRVLLTRGSTPVGEFPLDLLWSGPPLEVVATSEPPVAVSRYKAPDHPPFEKQGARIVHELLSMPMIRSPQPLLRASDVEAQALAELKPWNAGGVGTELSRSGPNDGSVILVGPQLIGLSEFAEGQEHELALSVGLYQREGISDARWEAEAAVDEAVRNWIAVGGFFGSPDSVAGLAVQWFGPRVQDHARCASELVAAMEGVRDAALALELPVMTSKASFSQELSKGFVACHAIGRLRGRRRARSADFKYAGDAIYVLGPEIQTLVGSRFADAYGCADPVSRRPLPDWSLARRIYSWFGGALGKEQMRLRSVHDISDGGLLPAIAECGFARHLGAFLRMPESVFPEAWAFGEGFHRFVVTCSDADSTVLEAEWDAAGVPYQRIGSVTATDRLEVVGCWSVGISELHRSWKGEAAR